MNEKLNQEQNTDNLTEEQMEAYVASQSKLTAEEEIKLEAQKDPDAHGNPVYNFNEETRMMILGTMLNDEEFLKTCIRVVKPKYFEDEKASAICAILFDLYKTYNTLPARYQIMEELERKVKAIYAKSSTLHDQLVNHRGHLNTCYDNYNGYRTKEYLKSLIKDFCQQRETSLAFFEAMENVKKQLPYLPSLKSKIEEVMSLEFENEYETWDAQTFFEYAKNLENNWVIEKWLPQNSLVLFSAEPKAGKSTLGFSIIPAIVAGIRWLDALETTQHHIILIDYENPHNYVYQNLIQYLPEEKWATLKERLTIPKKLPKAVTAEWITGLIKAKGLEDERVLVVIDSARRAFGALVDKTSNWENSASEVGKVVNPIHGLCHAENSKITCIIIHHDNKSGGVSGSGDWMGSVDFVWRYAIKPDGRILSIIGRLMEAVKPMKIKKNGLKVSRANFTADEELMETDKLKVLQAIPICEAHTVELGEDGITVSTLMERFPDLSASKGKRLREILADLREDTCIGAFKSPDVTKPIRYYRDSLLS